MAKQEKNTGKETPKVKEPKKVPFKISTSFQSRGKEPNKNREECATKILADAEKAGITKTRKGNLITKELVLRQISAMLRDINTERGKDKQSWWSKLTVNETDKLFQLVPK